MNLVPRLKPWAFLTPLQSVATQIFAHGMWRPRSMTYMRDGIHMVVTVADKSFEIEVREVRKPAEASA